MKFRAVWGPSLAFHFKLSGPGAGWGTHGGRRSPQLRGMVETKQRHGGVDQDAMVGAFVVTRCDKYNTQCYVNLL